MLARVLDIQDRTFSYKEPNILVQLAEVKASNSALYHDHARWRSLVGLVLDQLKARWNESEPTIIKPSNWANSLLAELMQDNGESRAVLLSSTAEEYLTAVFRGGSERVQYTYSLLQHLSTAFPEYSKTIAEVEGEGMPTVDLFMRLSLIAYAIQKQAFYLINGLSDDSHYVRCSFSELINNTDQALTKVLERFELEISPDELDRSIKANFKHHSKVSDRQFNVDDMQTVNNEVYTQYQPSFDSALSWYRAKFDRV